MQPPTIAFKISPPAPPPVPGLSPTDAKQDRCSGFIVPPPPWHKTRKRVLNLLLLLPLLPVAFLVATGWISPVLYAYSAVDPYVYYSYSPGFWSVDAAFWSLTPLMVYCFRRKGIGWLHSLIYAFCLDAASVGAFLTYFSLVYSVDIFRSSYYTMTFYFVFLAIVPVLYLKPRRSSWGTLFILGVIGILWRALGPGNVSYRITPSTVLDLASIFLWFLFFATLSFPDYWVRQWQECECCRLTLPRAKMFTSIAGSGHLCTDCMDAGCVRENGAWSCTKRGGFSSKQSDP